MIGWRRGGVLLASAAATLAAQPPVPCDTAGAASARHLVVEAATGTVRVVGDGGRAVGCVAVRGAGVRRRLDGDTLRIAIPGGTGVAAPTVEIRLPHGATVRVATLGAAVAVTATRGLVVVRAAAGRLDVEDVREIVGELGGARLRGRRVAGGVRLRSATGPVALDDVGGDLAIEGGGGAIDVRRGRGATVVLRTTSGRLRWQGEIDPVGRYDIRSATGPIDVVLAPRTVAAGRVERLRAALVLGDGLVETARVAEGARTVVRWTTVPAPAVPAAGGAEVVIRTTTGAVRIGRASAAASRDPSP